MGNSSSESPTVLQRKQVRPTGYNHPECCGIMAHKKQQTADQHEQLSQIQFSLPPAQGLPAIVGCCAAVARSR